MAQMIKRISKFALAVFFISMFTPIVAPEVLEESEARNGKVTICHRTKSVKNPYRRITVSNSALNSGHKNHTGGVWTTSSVQGDTWGDIIPDSTSGGSNSYALNFDATGQAIWRGQTLNPATGSAVCKVMTMKQFKDSEIAAGQSAAQVIASIKDAEADEDLALLQTLGLTFSTFDSTAELDSLVAASEAVIVSTRAASSVTTTTATLNGSVKTDNTALTCHFEYDDNSGFGSSTLNPSTATSVTLNATSARSVNLTGLTTNTKYYYRLVCHDSGGGDIYGDTFFFTTGTTYSVTYDSNTAASGTTPEDFSLYSSSDSAYIRGNEGLLVKTGYSFAGWTLNSDGSGTVYSPSNTATLAMTSNRILYAKWNANSFPITFDSNTATSGTMSNQTFTAGSAQSLTTNGFSKTGYTFAGWATSSGGSVVYSNTQSVTLYETATVYAKWTAGTFSVTFDSNTATSGTMSNQAFTAGTGQALTSNGFMKTGFSFLGWATSPSGSVVHSNTASITIYADITLYAKWVSDAEWRIDYDGNSNNSGSIPDFQTVTRGQPIATRSNSGSLARTGYLFDGWNTNSGGTGTPYATGANITPSANTTLYAKWVATTFPITFDSNTATSGSMSSQTFTAGTGQALTGNGFTKTGYSFAGWASTSGGSVVYTDSQTVTLYETATVYAKWTAGTFTLTFDSNTATSGTMSNQSFTADTPQSISSNGFSKIGAAFSGWATSSGGSVVYANGASLTINTNTTLYAIWGTAFSVTYTLDGGNGTAPTESDKVSGATFLLASGSGLSKSGFSFAGWSCNSGSTQSAGTSVTMPSGTLTCVAVWTANSSGGGSSGGSGNSGGNNSSAAARPTPAVVRKSATLVTLATTPVKSAVVAAPLSTTPGNSGSTPASSGAAPGNSGNTPSSSGATSGGASSTPSAPSTPAPGISGNTPSSVGATAGGSTSTPSTPAPGISGNTPAATNSSERLNVNNTQLSQTTSIAPQAAQSITFRGAGITQVNVVNNEVAVQARPGFSGKTTVTITVAQAEEVSTITADVIVLPLPVTNPVVRVVSEDRARIQWIRSPNAVTYEVTQNGKLLCTTSRTICTVTEPVAENAPVQIRALGRDQTESTAKQATYVDAKIPQVVPEVALVVNFDTAKYNLDAEDRRLIRAFAAEVVKFGFKEVDISGHTDSRGGIDNNVLSNNRAKSARAYLLSLVPNLKVTINGFADAINVAPNTTAQGLAANRRAEFRVVG
jgi:uncharacterized repeat protein (TIGR02543 family)